MPLVLEATLLKKKVKSASLMCEITHEYSFTSVNRDLMLPWQRGWCAVYHCVYLKVIVLRGVQLETSCALAHGRTPQGVATLL